MLTTADVALPATATPLAIGPSLPASRAEEREVEWALIEHRAGRFLPVDVTLPPLPESATAVMRTVAALYELVYGLRLALGDDRPVLFTVEWIAQKTGFPRTSVHRALRQLVRAGVLGAPEGVPRKGKRAAHAYPPGPGTLVDGRPHITPPPMETTSP